MKCSAPLVEVDDCGPDTQGLGHVCCMETNGTIDNATVVDVTSTNRSDGQPRNETMAHYLNNKRIEKERQTTNLLHKYFKANPEGWKFEDNGNLLKSKDHKRLKALENKVENRRHSQLFAARSNAGGKAKRKGKGYNSANAKSKKRRNKRRRRLEEEERIIKEKENETVMKKLLRKLTDLFKSSP